VSKAQTLAQLQALLARVVARSAGARGPGTSVGLASAPPEKASEPAELAAPTTWTPPPPEEPTAVTHSAGAYEDTSAAAPSEEAEAPPNAEPTAFSPEPTSAERQIATDAPTLMDRNVDPDPNGPADVELPTAELEVATEPPEPSPAPMREPSSFPDDVSGEVASQVRSDAPVFDDIPTEEAREDRAPASSRRPVAPQSEPRLEQLAFGTDDVLPPLHTPPPESGRVPASPDGEFNGDVTGVRETTPPPSKLSDLGFEPQPEADAEITRASLDGSVQVARFVGETGSSLPKTFLTVLDDALTL